MGGSSTVEESDGGVSSDQSISNSEDSERSITWGC